VAGSGISPTTFLRVSLHQIDEMFKQSNQKVSFHAENVFKEHELEEVATVKDYLTVQSAGVER